MMLPGGYDAGDGSVYDSDGSFWKWAWCSLGGSCLFCHLENGQNLHDAPWRMMLLWRQPILRLLPTDVVQLNLAFIWKLFERKYFPPRRLLLFWSITFFLQERDVWYMVKICWSIIIAWELAKVSRTFALIGDLLGHHQCKPLKGDFIFKCFNVTKMMMMTMMTAGLISEMLDGEKQGGTKF